MSNIFGGIFIITSRIQEKIMYISEIREMLKILYILLNKRYFLDYAYLIFVDAEVVIFESKLRENRHVSGLAKLFEAYDLLVVPNFLYNNKNIEKVDQYGNIYAYNLKGALTDHEIDEMQEEIGVARLDNLVKKAKYDAIQRKQATIIRIGEKEFQRRLIQAKIKAKRYIRSKN